MSAALQASAFRYRASTDAGDIVEGTLRVATRELALRELRRQQLWPVVVDPIVTATETSWRWRGGATARRRAVAGWVRTVATLLEAGATLDRALAVAQTQSTHDDMTAGAQAMRAAVQGGASLAEAMRLQPTLFDSMHAGVVRAGESAGALDTALSTLAGYLEEDLALRTQMAQALLYPALMACVATLGTLVLLLVVVPRFSTLLADLGGTMPTSTRILIGLGHVVRHAWWIVLAVLAAALIGARQWIAVPANELAWHTRRLSLPFVGALERAMVTARFTRALGLMLGGGLPLLPALRLARSGVTNRAMAADLERVSQDVARGQRLGASIVGVLSPMAVQLLAVGEESGKLDALCVRAATQHDEEVRRTLRTLASLLEPALIVLFGAIVGFVALAMLQAIYAINAGR